MAAGKFIFYDLGIRHWLAGNIDYLNQTIVALPLHNGYTPGTHSHSALAQITNFRSTASGTVVNGINLSSKELSFSANGVLKIDAADLAGFSSDGDTFKSKYLALYAQSASGGSGDNLLIGFVDLETTSTTGVEGTQVNITWPAGGIGKATINP